MEKKLVMTILYQITYTNIITGERQTYMDVGYETPKLAKDEIRRLMRDARILKNRGWDINLMYQRGDRIPTPMLGKYWRVKKVKCKLIKR